MKVYKEMPRTTKKRATNKKRQFKGRFRVGRTIPYANQKPPSAMVRFQGRQKYLCLGGEGTNSKSILRIPASFLGNPITEAGLISADNQINFINDFGNMFSKYNHYKVVAAKCTILIKPYDVVGETDNGQNSNLAFLARVDSTGTYSPATQLYDLEHNYGIVQRQWSKATAQGYRQARMSLGYNPKRQLNIKDWRDNAHIRCPTQYGSAANENTFFNMILAGELDGENLAHANCVAVVQCDYLVNFEEPTEENAPTILATA